LTLTDSETPVFFLYSAVPTPSSFLDVRTGKMLRKKFLLKADGESGLRN